MWPAITIALFISPIILGIGIFAFSYLKEEFYKFPLYENYED